VSQNQPKNSIIKYQKTNQGIQEPDNLTSADPIPADASGTTKSELKVPQKKYFDPRSKSSTSIKLPKHVDSRRDIDLLFQDMDEHDLNKLVDTGDINKIIELKRSKVEHTPKDQKQIEQIAIKQALAFQRDIQDVRRIRAYYSRQALKKSMERQAIGSSGYGRFLCSHYNPGSSFISSLNSISQKLENNIKEKKRIQKELRKREEDKNNNELNSDEKEQVKKSQEDNKKAEEDEEEESKTAEVDEKKARSVKDQTISSQKLKIDVEMQDQSKSPDPHHKTQVNLQNTEENKKDSESKDLKSNKKIASKSQSKSSKSSSKSKPKESQKDTKNNNSKPAEEKKESDPKEDSILAELERSVTTDNHNKMVHDILNQNNSRISTKKISSSSKTKKSKPGKDTIPRILKNDDDTISKLSKEATGKRAKKIDSKAVEESKNSDAAATPPHPAEVVAKASKPKEKKVKVPKPKKVKVESCKSVVKKIKPTKTKYQGSVVKKKFAPKKIGVPEHKNNSEANSDSFQVVAQIESDEEKNELKVEHGITVITAVGEDSLAPPSPEKEKIDSEEVNGDNVPMGEVVEDDEAVENSWDAEMQPSNNT